jgi:methyl-accepting chemotaxis protein
MKMFSKFPAGRFHFGLRAQILALGIAGVVIVGGLDLLSLRIERNSQHTADEIGSLALLTTKVSESLLQARQIATDFLQRRDEKKVAAHEEIVKTALGQLDGIERLVAGLPEGSPMRQAASFRSGINMYATRFSNVVMAQRLIGFNENDGLQGKLRVAVHEVEERLRKFDQPRLNVLMLMMRRHEKDFMLRGDEKYGNDLQKRAVEFSAELAKSDLPSDVQAEIKRLIEAYRSSFLAYMVGQSTLTEEATDLAQIYDRIRPSIAVVRNATDERIESVKQELSAVRTALLWAVYGTVALMVVSAFIFGRWLATPLIKMASAMEQLSQGELDTKVERFQRADEIGQISRALAVFHGKLVENRELTANQGEQRARAESERRSAMRQVADGFEGTVGQIVQAVASASSEIELASGNLTKTAEATQAISATVAAASEQSSSNVQSAAAAAEEMSASVTEIGRRVEEARRIAYAAVQQAEQTNDRIGELSQAAARIGDVVQMISAVAGQTNLLALNATIEAARAGEAGRGFAIVASEVKALAAQTAKATEEIGSQIAQMQEATRQSVVAIKDIGNTIAQISDISTGIASAVEEQGAATQEIARNVQHASQGAAQIAHSIVDVNHRAVDTGAATQQVHGFAASLMNEANRLKQEVDKFLATVRAA